LSQLKVPVREDPVQNVAFTLAFFILVQCTDPHVPDSRSSHLRLRLLSCEVEF